MNDYRHGNSASFVPSRRSFVGGTTAIAGAAALGLAAPSVFGQTPRTRMDIVTFAQDAARLANFEAAVQEMMDRSAADASDPRGWLAVANTHRDFCPNPMNAPKQMHYCYWFIAWHRAYISVTERKIRAISGDDSFSYPYWNWSSDRHIPQAFARAGSSLSNAVRYTPPRRLQDDEVDYFPGDPVRGPYGVAALYDARKFEARTRAQIPRSFGGIARPNAAGAYDNNRLEGTPHGPVHVYVGGWSDRGDTGDMTDFATAGRDPIFFAHHGNLDRLWEIWRQDPARKATEPTSDAFLNHRFVFTWIDGTPIEVPMSDVLDTTKLGYVYDSLDVFRTAPVGPMASAESAESASSRPPAIGRQTLHVPVQPEIAPDENERKLLEITDVEAPTQPMTVSVFVKPASAAADQLGTSIGTFSALRAGGEIAWPSQTLTFDITAAAKQYAGQQITVQLIPQRIRAQGAAPETYPPLKFGQMRIVTKGAGDHRR